MTRYLGVVVLLAFVAFALRAQTKAVKLMSYKEKVSYSIGLDIGKNFKQQSIDVYLDVLLKGLKDGFAGSTPKLSEQEINETMQKFQTEMMAKQTESARIAGEKNRKEGDVFLAENRKKEGVVTLPSGLQYKILQAGTGSKPTKDNSVVCNYRGTTIDGKEFDSSYKYGQPATFKIVQVIPGWVEALQLMPVGSKWQLFIPPDLAYGDRGSGPNIGPGATLIFDLELISIK